MRTLILTLAFVPTMMSAAMPLACYGRLDVKALKEEQCLAAMVYGEARGEAKIGQIAVAYTALNRAVNRSICDVILAPKQYSVFNGDAEFREFATNPYAIFEGENEIDQQSWLAAQEVAKAVIKRKVEDPTKGSTHYLAPKVMKIKGYTYPKWSIVYKRTTVIDGHHFFKKDSRV